MDPISCQLLLVHHIQQQIAERASPRGLQLLVLVALLARVPDHLVARALEHVVELARRIGVVRRS